MIKHLILVPFLFTLISCKEVEQVTDRTCQGGHCTNHDQQKPSACGLSNPIGSFQNSSFHNEPQPTANTKYQAQLDFQNNVATLTQYCVNSEGTANPVVTAGFHYDPFGKTIQFDSVNPSEQALGKLTCTAAFETGKWNIAYQGRCLVLTSGNQTRYWELGNL